MDRLHLESRHRVQQAGDGCAHCYAERMARRLKAMGQPRYRNGFKVTLHPGLLDLPLKWKQSRAVFVNSMSDLFHEDVPFSFVESVLDTIRRADRHIFQILTKRAERLCGFDRAHGWPDNLILGVSVENAETKNRIRFLQSTGAKTRFISFEPLIAPVGSLDLHGVDWVIVGGESGPGARPMEKEWVLEIRKQAADAGIPFFFKQ